MERLEQGNIEIKAKPGSWKQDFTLTKEVASHCCSCQTLPSLTTACRQSCLHSLRSQAQHSLCAAVTRPTRPAGGGWCRTCRSA